MRLKRILSLALPLACAALFSRLGVWQLSRLRERRAFNATLAERLSAPPVDVTMLPADTALAHYRRTSVTGVPLYDLEVAHAGRSRQGSPGVHLLTPFALAGRDTVVMVNRGWVYSPDAKTLEHARWRERDSASVSGYATTYQEGRRESGVGGPESTAEPQSSGPASPAPRVVRVLDHAAIERLVGRPVGPYLLVQTAGAASRAPGDSVPARLELPTLDEGPHRSYAVQWFSFAAIAVVGGVVLYRRSP